MTRVSSGRDGRVHDLVSWERRVDDVGFGIALSDCE